jgi:osmotically inducible lipoprotein OsmB
MKSAIKVLAVVAALSFAGCSNMSPTEQRVLSGAAIGTIGGAAIGGGRGALIGAGVGALGGYLFDRAHRDDYYY